MTDNQSSVRDYDVYPEGWNKVTTALVDRGVEWGDACALTDQWKATRFSGTEVLRLIVEHGVFDHGGVEAWQAATGKARP